MYLVGCGRLVVFRGGSGIERVVRPTIVAHRRRWCPEALSVFAEVRSADLSAQSVEKYFRMYF